MKTIAREFLRWAVIVASGGYGAWQVTDAIWRIVTRWNGDWFNLFFCLLLVPTILAAPFLAVAYFCLRRQYRKLFLVLGAVGAVVLFMGLSMLPRELGVHEFLDRHRHGNEAIVFLMLLLPLLFFFGPIYAAAWFFRLCQRWAYPKHPGRDEKDAPKTRSTRWLVGLGVLLMMLPMLGAVLHFHLAAQSPPRTAISESLIDNWLHWTMASTTFGTLLLFLGLVRRRPVCDVPGEHVDCPVQSASASMR